MTQVIIKQKGLETGVTKEIKGFDGVIDSEKEATALLDAIEKVAGKEDLDRFEVVYNDGKNGSSYGEIRGFAYGYADAMYLYARGGLSRESHSDIEAMRNAAKSAFEKNKKSAVPIKPKGITSTQGFGLKNVSRAEMPGMRPLADFVSGPHIPEGSRLLVWVKDPNGDVYLTRNVLLSKEQTVNLKECLKTQGQYEILYYVRRPEDYGSALFFHQNVTVKAADADAKCSSLSKEGFSKNLEQAWAFMRDGEWKKGSDILEKLMKDYPQWTPKTDDERKAKEAVARDMLDLGLIIHTNVAQDLLRPTRADSPYLRELADRYDAFQELRTFADQAGVPLSSHPAQEENTKVLVKELEQKSGKWRSLYAMNLEIIRDNQPISLLDWIGEVEGTSRQGKLKRTAESQIDSLKSMRLGDPYPTTLSLPSKPQQ